MKKFKCYFCIYKVFLCINISDSLFVLKIILVIFQKFLQIKWWEVGLWLLGVEGWVMPPGNRGSAVQAVDPNVMIGAQIHL